MKAIDLRTIIAGSRRGISYQNVCDAMDACGWTPTEIVSGKAAGADTFGEWWAIKNKIPIKEFPAKWADISHVDAIIKHDRFGRKYDARAGIRRNHEMGDYADALVACWDGVSRGTKDMIDYATKKGLKVFVWKVEK